MAVSLFDMMRPVALAAGVGAVSAAVSRHDGSWVLYSIAIGSALTGGILAIVASQMIARRLDAWAAARQPGRTVELLWMGFYLAVFSSIVLATLGAGHGALSVMTNG